MTPKTEQFEDFDDADLKAAKVDTETYKEELVASSRHTHDGAKVGAAASGAALGATAGIFAGPVGAAVGAVVGGTIGAIVGIGMDDAAEAKSERNRELDDGTVPLAPEVAVEAAPAPNLPPIREVERDLR